MLYESKSPIESNAVYTREEAAGLLGISLSTLKYLIRAGHLTVSQPPGLRRVFIKGSSILEMLDRTTKCTGPNENQAAEPETANLKSSESLRAPSRPLTASRSQRASMGVDHNPPALRAGKQANRLHRASGHNSGPKGGAHG